MELILVIAIFAASFFLLSIGIIFSKKQLHAGTCSSKVVVKGEELTCGVCASREAEVCLTGDKDGYATLAQLGNPKRKRKLNKLPFSEN